MASTASAIIYEEEDIQNTADLIQEEVFQKKDKKPAIKIISKTSIEPPEEETESFLHTLTELDLPSEDGVPMETNWHRQQMNLLIELVHSHWQDRNDYFVGGNMFIYFSASQLKNEGYKGPDFFLVKNTDGTRDRRSWVVWQEKNKYPDVIVELASPSTLHIDLKEKKQLYEQTFRTSEYICYDPETENLQGWRLIQNQYEPMPQNDKGWLWSEELGAWFGKWRGSFLKNKKIWVRLYTYNEKLVPTFSEKFQKQAKAEAKRSKAQTKRADAEAKRAELAEIKAQEESKRADAAQEELMRLRSWLAKHGIV
ncbi:MAG: Uma2 family endonuclease [Desulfobacterales bacterium]|nr:Uma2 family endonuclease [Desulfobacterales bacterium]